MVDMSPINFRWEVGIKSNYVLEKSYLPACIQL